MKRLIANLTVLGLGGAMACLAVLYLTAGGSAAAPPPKVVVENAPLTRETKLATSFAPVIKQIAPSVVYIYTTKTVRESPGRPPEFDEPIFRFFFGPDFMPPVQPRERQQHGLGSGVIVSEDGYLLTNNHVVEGADEIKVVLSDNKTEYGAKVIGTDAPTDIAVLKIEAKGLPAATLTDSDKLEVGDLVLAIGNPFGVGQTVTMGIVSAVGRGLGLLGQGGYEDFIQIDASINPGNSGGALVDAQGRVVGINTAIISRSGGNQGIGFAVPINLARTVMERIVEDGRVVRGYLGVNIQPVTPDLAKAFNLKDDHGALVASVEDGTPAKKAGLQEGDVIIEFNGRKVEDSRHLRFMVAQTKPDTKVTLKVMRDGKSHTLEARLGELSPDKLAKTGPGSRGGSSGRVLDGVQVSDLNNRLRQQFDIPSDLRGALVTDVDITSPAYRAGLRPGDVILEINREEVRNADEAISASRKTEGDRVLLRVWSQGGSRYLVVNTTRAGK